MTIDDQIRDEKLQYDINREALKDLKEIKKQKTKQIHADDYKNKLWIPKEREIFKNFYSKRLDKIEELDQKID